MDALRLYSNPAGLLHDTGLSHPENIQRLQLLRRIFNDDYPHLTHIEAATDISIEWLKTLHAPDLIEQLQTHRQGVIDSDTLLSEHSWQAAKDGVALACQAIDDILSHQTQAAFCALRPPGHHAEYDRAMGFCLLNNAYAAAAHACKHGACRNVCILDWDVHHGNGTEDLIRTHNPEGIHLISIHQHPLFPGSGGADSNDSPNILNCPIPAGTSSAQYRALFGDIVMTRLHAIAPDLIIISAGFDAHRDDPLANIALDEEDYGWMIQTLHPVQNRICAVLEGGYNLEALENCVIAVLDSLTA